MIPRGIELNGKGTRITGIKRNIFDFNILENCRRVIPWLLQKDAQDHHMMNGDSFSLAAAINRRQRNSAVIRLFSPAQLKRAFDLARSPEDIFAVALIAATYHKLGQYEISDLIGKKDPATRSEVMGLFSRQKNYCVEGAGTLAQIADKFFILNWMLHKSTHRRTLYTSRTFWMAIAGLFFVAVHQPQ